MRWYILLALVSLAVLILVQDSESWWTSRRRASTPPSSRRRYTSTRRRYSTPSYERRRRTYTRRRRTVSQGCGYLYCYNGGVKYCHKSWWSSKKVPKCRCPKWTKGSQCQIDLCKRFMKCYNGGTKICVRKWFFFIRPKCQCKTGFYGKHCEHKTCPHKSCHNGGTATCLRRGVRGVTVCRCRSGFYGSSCQHGCPSKRCYNGGSRYCTNGFLWGGKAAKCRCPRGWGNHDCSRVCPERRCVNGGTPYCRLGRYPDCKCPRGFYGKYCDKGCPSPFHCDNGGNRACNDHDNTAYCTCFPGFSGRRCETGCNLIRCKNGGTYGCNGRLPVCGCPPGFGGKFCEIAKTTPRPTIVTTLAPTLDPLLTVKLGQFTFNAEGDEDPKSPRFSRKLHVFVKSSGVTIGRGYDFRDKKQGQIKKDLVDAGVDSKTAEKLKQASGLTDGKAKSWIQKKKLAKFTITKKQQKVLFENEYSEKAKLAKKMTEKYSKNGLKFDKLSQVVKDIIIDIFYRGDYSMNSSQLKRRSVYMQKIFDQSKQSLTALNDLMNDYTFWVIRGGVDDDRYAVRVQEVSKACAKDKKCKNTNGSG